MELRRGARVIEAQLEERAADRARQEELRDQACRKLPSCPLTRTRKATANHPRRRMASTATILCSADVQDRAAGDFLLVLACTRSPHVWLVVITRVEVCVCH